MYFLGIILASIVGYFVGSISWSIIITNWVKGVDIRKTGSGNAGATNTLRLMGPYWGFVVALLDALKVWIAAIVALALSFIPNELFAQTSYFIPAIFVLIGHCWPVYYKFKGGKAVSCFIGLIALSNILYLVVFLIVWWICFFISRKVSLCSLVAAVTIGILIWLPWLNGLTTFAWQWNSYDIWMNEAWYSPWLRFSWFNYFHAPISKVSGFQFADGMLEIVIVNFIGGIILIYRHSSNIVRLKNHVEPEFPKLTKEEKAKLKALRKAKKSLKRPERKELKRLEKIELLVNEQKKLNSEMVALRKKEAQDENDEAKKEPKK